MSAQEKIARLQELLERVQMRAAEPRRAVHAPAAAVSASPLPPVARMASAAPLPVPVTPEPPPVAAPAFTAPEADLEMMPAATDDMTSSPPPPTVEYDVDSDSDVEVSSEVVDIDIDMDEPMPLESGAQPVAHQTTPPGEIEEELEPLVAAPAEEPAAELEEVIDEAPLANEIEEPSPSSSRRPIANEEAAEEAYSEESAPRHTPPPESGKQVAASPSTPPARTPSNVPSMPPPSLEGHTLIGGWREPGLGGPQFGPPGGAPVRVPAPGPGAGPGPAGMGTEPSAAVIQQAPAAQPSGTRLSPDVTRPNLPAHANVASFEGAVQVAKPKTLGELLDLTLGL